MFRRSQDQPAAATALAEQDQTTPAPRDPQAPKGRPTPKRSEAESTRRARVVAPKDRKSAARDARARLRVEREKQRQALLNGEERYLPARDKGPVRRFARDYVDSRMAVAEWFLPFAVIILVLSLVRNSQVQFLVVYIWLLLIVAMVLDSLRLGLGLRKQLRERFPDESHKGVLPYALMRSLQMRRLRLPKPQVKRGARP